MLKAFLRVVLPHSFSFFIMCGDIVMFWIIRLLLGKSDYVWFPVRILKETDKAILVEIGRKIWIAKSRIVKIRLRKGVSEVYVRKNIIFLANASL